MPITMPADVRAGVERTHADFVATASTVSQQCAQLGKCNHQVVLRWQDLAQRFNRWFLEEWDDGYGIWGDDLTMAERYGAELLTVRRALSEQGFNFYVITRHEDPNVTHGGELNPNTKKYFGYAAVAAGVTVAVFGIWQIVKISAVSKMSMGMQGLPSGAFAGARFPVQRARSKPRGARALRGLPKRAKRSKARGKRGLRGGFDYNMEVQ